ncbi:peptide/nickel transport system permease protein [Lentibacillus halodurans]|uniref:Peptide/nickel transport system permease protein n=1 Tax=Lentibacillus halodurans TaxID=237679 RepID=A0A1I0X7G0_9BACI|nr:oligopeptide ABC transporter permease [Lentibacillus halodurans]SFA96979.1 peptide/nickel transport system permease protein [Lentibacillus halodurans]
MLAYTIRRLLSMIPLLILISVVVFSLAKLMPGDPFTGEIDPNNTNTEYIEEMREELGYNDPILVQYQRWVTNVLQGDFGKSTTYKKPVTEVIAERLPNTIFLAISALIITYILAFTMGMYSGRRPYTLGDNFIATFNYTGIAIPQYIVAIVAIYFFAFQLGWFPSGGSITPGLEQGSMAFWTDRIYHVILPAITLGLFSTASYTQFLRNDIVQNSKQDYVRSARARGTKESVIYNKHILRNSVIPLVTFFGFDLATLIGGAIITETIFTYPGIGMLFIDSVTTRDYPVVMTLTLVFSFLTLAGNLIADLLYGVVDPRIRY